MQSGLAHRSRRRATSSSSHCRFCRFCTHSKKEATMPPPLAYTSGKTATPRSRRIASPSAVVGALAASTTACLVCGCWCVWCCSWRWVVVGAPGLWLVVRVVMRFCVVRCRRVALRHQPSHKPASYRGGGTLHCSRGAVRALMTPPSAAGTSTSQGIVKNSASLGSGVPPSKSQSAPPLCLFCVFFCDVIVWLVVECWLM